MNSKEFESLLRKHVLPMFPGAFLRSAEPEKKGAVKLATLLNRQEIAVRWKSDRPYKFLLKRTQEFSAKDASFIHSILSNLQAGGPLSKTFFLEDMLNPSVRRAVAQQVAPKSVDVVASLLRRFERWSEETYEGRPITAALGIDRRTISRNGVLAEEVFDHSFGVVLANGL